MFSMKNRTKAIAITVGALAAGAVLVTGATGVALAADSPTVPSASPTSTSTSTSTAVDRRGADHGRPGRGMGRGPAGQPLHGELTVKQADGSIATIATVNGTVTAVSATSITVQAADGYTATYAVTADTDVRVGVPTRPTDGTRPTAPTPSADSIADVAVGDVAHVHGTVAGSSKTATEVHAMTAEQAAQLEADRAQHDAARPQAD